MKLKTNNAAKKPLNTKKNKSQKKQSKGVEIRKEKSKEVVKQTVLKKEGEKVKAEVPISPHKALQQELWDKAILNVSNMPNLSDEEGSITKLLSDYKKKSSIPQRRIKLKNFITKGFSKFKDTSDEVLEGIYDKISNEYKALGGSTEVKESPKKSDTKIVKTKSKKDDDDDDDDEDEIDNQDEENDDEIEDEDDIAFSDEEEEEEEEEEKPKPKAKGNSKNGKIQPNKGKNGSKFKGGKVQKNKKFAKKK